jgi:hypothetical protein
MVDMSYWIILHHHRNGTDTYLIESEQEPSDWEVVQGLLKRGYNPSSDEEFWEKGENATHTLHQWCEEAA